MWTMPMLFFFLTSSAASRAGRTRKREFNNLSEKSSVRDALQVLANGGTAVVFLVVWHIHAAAGWYVAALGSLAAATADTWGTELGFFNKSSPRLITNMRKTEPGRSGAVSLPGVASGFAGAFGIWVVASPWLKGDGPLLAIVTGGMVGTLADSFLGATVQMRYFCKICGKTTERMNHCGSKSVHVGGVWPIRNDLVNLLCTALGGVSAWLIA